MRNVITIACLFFAIHASGNPPDTLCEMIKGKCNYEFDYKTSEIISESCESYHIRNEYLLSPCMILCLDLFDKEDNKLFFRRKITLYFRNGSIESFKTNSKDEEFFFPGSEIKRIQVSRPIL